MRDTNAQWQYVHVYDICGGLYKVNCTTLACKIMSRRLSL